MDNFVAIDFETANGKRSSVCSVGIVVVKDGEVVEEKYSLIHPYPNYYTPWTTAVHGLTDCDTCDALPFDEVWEKLTPIIGNLPLVAHNAAFDRSCLEAAHRAYGIYYPDYEFYCTLIAARRVLKGLPNYQLHTVSAECGYILENHHNALADAEACACIAKAII